MWPFKKKQPPAQRDLRCNGDWRPGDLAACIVDGVERSWDDYVMSPPRYGEICKVIRIFDAVNDRNTRAYWLEIEGYRSGYPTTAFRRVQKDEAACEDEFRIAMQNLAGGQP